MKKWILIAIAVIILFFVLIWFFFIRPKPTQFTTARAQKSDITSIVNTSGKVSSEDEANLSFKISGKVNWISPKVGDTIKKGQAIATLDKKDLEIVLSQKEAALRSAESDLAKVRDDIRLFQYGNQGTIGETQAQKNLREEAEAAKDVAYEGVQAAKEGIRSATLISPVAGTLVTRDTEVGQNVTANVAVFKIANLSKIIFVVEIDETDIGKIKIGQKTKITLDAYSDKEVEGEVAKIYPQTTTTETGATIIKTEIKLANIDSPLILGLSGDAEIITDKKEGVLSVPSDAVLEEEGKRFVFIVENGLAKKREVTIGIYSDERTEILKGIEEETTVVSSNLDKVKEGQKIESAKQ